MAAATRKVLTPTPVATPPGTYVPLSQSPPPAAVARKRNSYAPAKPGGGTSPYGQALTGAFSPEQQQQFRSDPANRSVIDQISQAATTRYGQANDNQVLGLSNKVINEGYPIEEAMRMLQGGYGVSDPNLRYVADQVASQYGPQQGALERAQRESQLLYDRGIATEQGFGQRADASLKSIYDSLQAELTQNQGALQGYFDDARTDTQGAYQQAASGVQGAGADLLARLTAQGEQLGIGAGTAPASGDIASDLAFYASQLQGGGADAAANLSALGAGQLGIGQRGIGDSRRELAQNRTGILNQVLKAVSDLGLGYQSEQRDLSGQLADLAQARGADMRTGLQDRNEQQWQRAMEGNAANLDAEIQRGTLGIQQGELSLQQQEMLSNLSMRSRELDQQIEIARMNNSTDLQGLEIERQKVQNEMNRYNLDANGGVPTSGMPAVERFFTSAQAEAASPGGEYGVGPQFRSRFNDLITQASDAANVAMSNGQAADPRTIAMTLVSNLPSSFDRNLMMQALDMFFGAADYRSA